MYVYTGTHTLRHIHAHMYTHIQTHAAVVMVLGNRGSLSPRHTFSSVSVLVPLLYKIPVYRLSRICTWTMRSIRL